MGIGEWGKNRILPGAKSLDSLVEILYIFELDFNELPDLYGVHGDFLPSSLFCLQGDNIVVKIFPFLAER